MNKLLDAFAITLTPEVQAELIRHYNRRTAFFWVAGDVPEELHSRSSYAASGIDGIMRQLHLALYVIEERCQDIDRAGLSRWIVSRETPEIVLLLGMDFPFADKNITSKLKIILRNGRIAGVRVVRVLDL